MSTAFVSLVDGVAAVLQAAHPTVRVFANRVRPVGANEGQALLVRLQGTRRDAGGPLSASDWQTAILVDCVARTSTGADPAQALDALLASAWAALLGVPLQLPDVFDLDADPAIDWDFDAADTPLAVATIRLVVRHRTQPNTLTPWSLAP